MGGFLTGFFSAGGNEALEEKHRHEQQADQYRQANLQQLMNMRQIAAEHGVSPDILGQLDQSIAGLQPHGGGFHRGPAQPQGPAATSTPTSVAPIQLPGIGSAPMVGESPSTDITGNTPRTADATPGQAPLPPPAPPDTTALPPQPGVFMQGGAIPKPAAADTTPIVPPSIQGQASPGPVIPGQPGPTVTGPTPQRLTPGQLLGQALNPTHLAMQQAYVKNIAAQAEFEQNQRQFQQTLENMGPILSKHGVDDKTIQMIKQDAAIQQYSPRAFMMMNRVPHLASSGALDVQGAISEQERTGEPFYDRNNQPIDLGFVSQNFPNAQLNPVYGPGGQQYWEVGSQANKVYNYDNQAVIGPSRGKATGDNTQVLGAKQVPATTNRQVPSAGGGVLNLSTTRTPQTPAPKTQPSVVNPTGAPALKRRDGSTVSDYQGNPLPADAVTQPQTTASGATTPKGTTSAKTPAPAKVGDFVRNANNAALEKSVQTQGIEPDMNKLYPQQGVAARKALPALVATRGIFGDPERPELPTISQFSDLANDPHAQRVLGAAFKLMENTPIQLENPTGITDGTLSTIAADNGFKNWQAEVMAKVQQQALAGATPRELAYFNSAINAMADVIGLRGATGQNAAQWSVQALQNEVPLIGTIGTKNQQAYLQKLMALNSTAGNIINTMPDNGRAKFWLQKREKDLEALQNQAPKSAPKVDTGTGGIQVGQSVKLRNGTTVKVKTVHPDGSFDPE